jgi:dihydrofolate reductase
MSDHKKPIISMIAAIANNNVIGDGEKMPWHVPEDLKLFRNITSGKPVIMGRKTYESIGRPLPKRHNIVMTRDTTWHAEGVSVVQSIDAALHEAAQSTPEEICIIGGGAIYQQFLSRADRIYLTRMGKNFIGNARFPEWNDQEWTLTKQHHIDLENDYEFEIIFEQRDRI